DAFHFRFKRPEDTWNVTWRQDGRLQHKAGFKYRDETSAWANEHLDDGTETEVSPPFSRNMKVAAGEVQDPGAANLKAIVRLLLARSAYRSQRALASTNSAADAVSLFDQGAQSLQDGAALQLSGHKWYRVNDASAPHLNGRYVHDDALV